MQMVRYLHSTWSYAIHYGSDDTALQGWLDAAFKGDTRVTHAMAGMILTMYGGAVSWQS